MVKDFFSITKEKYCFEWCDFTTILTIANVALIICGWRFAPLIGIFNSIFCIGLSISGRAHINAYVTQLALIILNVYFMI
jgi:hypothetical protein